MQLTYRDSNYHIFPRPTISELIQLNNYQFIYLKIDCVMVKLVTIINKVSHSIVGLSYQEILVVV